MPTFHNPINSLWIKIKFSLTEHVYLKFGETKTKAIRNHFYN